MCKNDLILDDFNFEFPDISSWPSLNNSPQSDDLVYCHNLLQIVDSPCMQLILITPQFPQPLTYLYRLSFATVFPGLITMSWFPQEHTINYAYTLHYVCARTYWANIYSSKLANTVQSTVDMCTACSLILFHKAYYCCCSCHLWCIYS